MDSPPDFGTSKSDIFDYLIFGLKAYLDNNAQVIPKTLRHAMNLLVLEMGKQFPKTLHHFITLCHQPTRSWYPNTPADFDSSQSLIYDNNLSEAAQDFHLRRVEQMGLAAHSLPYFELSQDALDNLKIVELLQELQQMPDRAEAQSLYVAIRSFLIAHSWASLDTLRAQYAIFPKLKQYELYEPVPELPFAELIVCERCGLLRWQNRRWQGVKPDYCSDHDSGSLFIHPIPNRSQLYRLRTAIHRRVFLPGQIELALFNLADELADEYSSHLAEPERYPGLDAYDLRLTFSDGEIWATDAKDQADAVRLCSELHLPYGEGDLAYTYVFYVIPDERMNEADYREKLEHTRATRPAKLAVVSFSEFQERLQTKLETLAKPPRQRKNKKV